MPRFRFEPGKQPDNKPAGGSDIAQPMYNGRHKWEPTPRERSMVTMMAACGITQEDIALSMDMHVHTLEKHFRQELKTGAIRANAIIGKRLFRLAAFGPPVAAFFWAKTRMRWRENEREQQTGQTITIVGGLPDDED